MVELRGTMSINQSGNLEIGGVDVNKIERESEYPVYVIDEALLRDNMKNYVNAFKEFYPNASVHYASKALMCMGMCKIVESEGLGLYVVS